MNMVFELNKFNEKKKRLMIICTNKIYY